MFPPEGRSMAEEALLTKTVVSKKCTSDGPPASFKSSVVTVLCRPGLMEGDAAMSVNGDVRIL